jgi:phosphopantetheinyl transferase
VSEGPVGVDLEIAHGHGAPQTAALTVRERAGVAALAPGRQGPGSLRLWTAKEAVLKASGRSLADDPSTIEVVDLLDGDVAEVVDGKRTWTVRHVAFDPPANSQALLAVADLGGGEAVWRSLR